MNLSALLLPVTFMASASAVTHLLSMLCLAIGSDYQTGVFSCLPEDRTLAGCGVEALVKNTNHIQKASRRGGNVSFCDYCLLDFVEALRHELFQPWSRERSTPNRILQDRLSYIPPGGPLAQSLSVCPSDQRAQSFC